jgi:hypothetical protein
MSQQGANQDEAGGGGDDGGDGGSSSRGKVKIPVSSYKKSDGTKVSQYKRSIPARSGGGKRATRDDGDGEGQQDDTPPADPRGHPKKPATETPRYTMEEYVAMAIEDHANAVNALVDGNELDEALVRGDAASNAAAQIPEEELGPAGFEDFLQDLEDEARENNVLNSDIVQSIILNASEQRYHDDAPGSWKKHSLQCHLQKAGLPRTTLKVQSQQYIF